MDGFWINQMLDSDARKQSVEITASVAITRRMEVPISTRFSEGVETTHFYVVAWATPERRVTMTHLRPRRR